MKEQERKKRKNSMQQPEETSAFGANADTANTANAVAGSAAVPTAGGAGFSSVWPHQAAERVRLLVPDEYKTAQEKQQQQQQQNDNEKPLYCHLHYHAARHVLLVVMKSENNNDNDDEKEMIILDIIHANDLIGAGISVELTAEANTADTMHTSSPPCSPRSSNHHSGSNDNDNIIDEDDDNANDDSNDNSNHGRATNEPPSDSLHDHRGHAILSLYVYPRQDPATYTWLYRLGITSHYAPPGPPPRQSLTAFLKEHQQQQEQEALLLQAGQPRFAHVRKFILAPAEDLSGIPTLLAAIRQLAKPTTTTTATTKQSSDISRNHNETNNKKYLIIVNPKSGPKKNAATICQTLVLPMLQQAGVVETKLVITTHPHHAKELMSGKKINSNNNNNSSTVKKKENNHDDDNANDEDINILDYNGIILMGGDGIMHEVLNGIMQRPDAHNVLQNITLGIVGCGSCNGLAATIAHASHEAIGNVVNQVFLIAKGYQGVRMDISRYQTLSSSTSTSPSYSFLTFAYGLIADIDIESELLHWLGEVRIDVWAVWRVLFSLRRYRARFSYLPPCPSGTTTTALPPPDGILPKSVTDPLPTSGNDDNNDENKHGWKTLSSNNDEDDDDYNNGIILFWASQVSHAAEHTHQAPDSQLQDGLFKIMLIRNTKTITKWQVARILLALASGKHVDLAGVEFIDCVAYRLEPLDNNDTKNKDLNVLDGEVIESGPIQAQVFPSMVRIFCNPPTTQTPSN